MLETERLILRRWRRSDFNHLVAILSDPDVMRFSDHGPLSARQVETWLSENCRGAGAERLGSWAIELKRDGSVIGYVSISRDVERLGLGDAELGLRLAKKYWRQGYANEAAIQMIAFAFEDQSVSRVVGIVDPDNSRSVRMLESLGMIYDRDISFEDYDYPDRLFALPRERCRNL